MNTANDWRLLKDLGFKLLVLEPPHHGLQPDLETAIEINDVRAFIKIGETSYLEMLPRARPNYERAHVGRARRFVGRLEDRADPPNGKRSAEGGWSTFDYRRPLG